MQTNEISGIQRLRKRSVSLLNSFIRNDREGARFARRVVSIGVIGIVGTITSVSGAAISLDEHEIGVDRELARLMVRNSIIDLGIHESPARADYGLLSAYLSIANDLDPTNPEYARLFAEAAWAAGDNELMLDATRMVIKRDPENTVAQLRLVSSLINEKQTITDRLAIYDRFLGESGRRLAKSVRSRLALDAALLERERGDTSGFVTRLQLALKLDMTNKAAASLAAQYYGQVTQDPVVWLEHQIDLLFADPLDPNVYMTMTRLLAKEGAFEPANRFLENAIKLYKLESGRSPSTLEEVRLSLKWQLQGAGAIEEELGPILISRRAEAQSKIDSYEELQLPTDELNKPEDIRYEVNIDKLRLLSAYIVGDMENVQLILNDLQTSVNAEINAIGEAMTRRGVDQNQLLQLALKRTKELQAMRAIVGLEATEIRKDVEVLVDGVEAMRSHFAVVEPMALYAEGKFQEAYDGIREFPSSATTDLIQALAAEKIGEMDRAIELYTQLANTFSLEGIGAFARSRLIVMNLEGRVVSSHGHQMIRIADTIPTWIDMMIDRPSTFVYLAMVEPERQIDSMDTPRIHVRLRNMAPIPLAVGPASPLSSRILLVSSIDNHSGEFQGNVKSKVLNLDHRIKLDPQEELVVEIDADSAQTQWLMEMQSNVSIRQRWRLLQGFEPRLSESVARTLDAGSDAAIYGITQSPLGLTAETGIVQRLGLIESKGSLDELVESIHQARDEESSMRLVRAAAGRLLLPRDNQLLSMNEKEHLVDALLGLYERSGNSVKGQMILQLPHRHQEPTMIAFDDLVVSSLVSDGLINSQVDPVLLACALLTRVDDVESPIFDILDQTSDPRIDEIAEVIRARLSAGVVTFGRIGPGVESVLEPARDSWIP